MIDITDVRHAAVNVKAFNEHPAERTQEEVVQYDSNERANDL